jgi:hypothetical protein
VISQEKIAAKMIFHFGVNDQQSEQEGEILRVISNESIHVYFSRLIKKEILSVGMMFVLIIPMQQNLYNMQKKR